MFTEKHILGNPYNGHHLSRTVTGYEVTTVDCSADKTSGWNGTTVNLTPDEAPAGYAFSGWNITGATITGSAFNFVGNDVGVSAIYGNPPELHRVYCYPTGVPYGRAKFSADIMSGYPGDVATLTASAVPGIKLNHYEIDGATLTGNQFTYENTTVYVTGYFDYKTAGKFIISGIQSAAGSPAYVPFSSMYYSGTLPSSDVLLYSSVDAKTGANVSTTLDGYVFNTAYGIVSAWASSYCSGQNLNSDIYQGGIYIATNNAINSLFFFGNKTKESTSPNSNINVPLFNTDWYPRVAIDEGTGSIYAEFIMSGYVGVP